MRTSRKLLLVGIVVAIILPVASEIVQAYRTTVVIPSLVSGGVKAETGRARGFFASMIRPIYNMPGTSLTYFFPNEAPSIGSAQPEDAIIFTCPAGTNIPVSRAFSRFSDGRNQWLWGPYVGDEADRLAAGQTADTVFPPAKFMGRATGFGFVDGTRSLVVPANATNGGMFFATADPPAGARYLVRCSVPATSACGDGFIDGTEQCDDGAGNSNTTPNACRTTCVPAACGDGTVDAGEQCDDGNTVDGDGCSSACQTQPVAPAATCGNGTLDSGEACDDGNAVAGDGCSATCQVESGYSCTGVPSSCAKPAGPAVCGNGVREGSEECDDGNASFTDSCLPSCMANVCGDGYKSATEQCDDGKTCLGTDIYGNPVGDGRWCVTDADCASQPGTTCAVHNGDGCSTTCTVEQSYVCQLKADTHAPTPERSYCALAAPTPTSSTGNSGPIGSAPTSSFQSYPSSAAASSIMSGAGSSVSVGASSASSVGGTVIAPGL